MSDCDCPPAPKCEEGLPAWMGTFADLMSLLMCFFVLLLSFSEMDALKYKQVAGSMRFAFGVQREVKTAKEIPKGTSIIAKEFSPGRPEPTLLNVVKQFTIDPEKPTLKFDPLKKKKSDPKEEKAKKKDTKKQESKSAKANAESKIKNQIKRKIEVYSQVLKKALDTQIAKGMVDVDRKEGKIVVRIRESGSFSPGGADLNSDFLPVLYMVAAVLEQVPGKISVAGHTDDVGVSSGRYRNNWELASARAINVTEELLAGSVIERNRIVVEGYAETQPMVPNDSNENRAQNRRVEIVLDTQPYLDEVLREFSVE